MNNYYPQSRRRARARRATFRPGGHSSRYVIAGTVLAAAVLAGVIALTSVMSSANTGSDVAQLSAAPLGVNVAPWDYAYAADVSAGGGANVMQGLLKYAGIDQFRYGGGGYADYYDWENNRNITNCLPSEPTAVFTSNCSSADSLGFAQFSRQAKAIGADSFVTVNYGSGTPAEAAAWVAAADKTQTNRVALWEIGNEGYLCWEVNNELAGSPEYYRGYKLPKSGTLYNPSCPLYTQGPAVGTQTLATSYAVNALKFLKAMKAVDPAAKIGVPWAFGNEVLGESVTENSEWNDTVLKTDGQYVSFVDAHYYPFYFTGSPGGNNPSDSQILQSLKTIPTIYSKIRAGLNAYDPQAAVVIGETAVSSAPTTTSCTPVGAVFAAGDALSWLAAGAETVDWWDLNNYGNRTSSCVQSDYGFFTSSSPPKTETPYVGYLLASMLAKPDATLSPMATSNSANVLAFQATLPNGGYALALLNLNTSSAETVTFQPQNKLSTMLKTWTYSPTAQNSSNSKIRTRQTSAAAATQGISLPAESITILETE
jgi:hypothetical protein